MLTTHHAGTVKIVINERKARGDLPLIHIKPRFAEGYIIPSECSFQTSWNVFRASSGWRVHETSNP
jgi:hypothetical protein